jgi:hypothetical protein
MISVSEADTPINATSYNRDIRLASLLRCVTIHIMAGRHRQGRLT